MPTLRPVTNPLVVNTITSLAQQQSSVTKLTGGGFVVTWTDNSHSADDATGAAVRGQIFDASGAKIGSEFLVPSTTSGDQSYHSVRGLANGGFVVTWTDTSHSSGDTSSTAVRGQVFDASGARSGAEFLVNTITTDGQEDPSVADLTDGGFVVTWTDGSRSADDTSVYAVRGQKFDATGSKISAEFLVNTTTMDYQLYSSASGLAGGGFVVTWQDESLTAGDTTGTAVRGQLFDAVGAKIGTEFVVNSTTSSNQGEPSVSGLAGGGFVVTWDDNSQSPDDPSALAVRGQVYDSLGAKIGTEFLVNTSTASYQDKSSVSGLTNGGFIVTWQDGGTNSVRGQLFDANGTRTGIEFAVDTVMGQSAPSVAGMADGSFVVSWSTGGGDVGARVFSYSTAPTSTPGSGGAFVEDAGAVALASSLVVTDPDSTTLARATVQITGNLRTTEDVLTFAPGAANVGNIAAGTYNTATGALVLTSAGGTATLAQWQTALRLVTYGNTSHNPDTVSRTVSFTLSDALGAGTAGTTTVNVAGANDAPTVANAIADRTTVVGSALTLQFAANTFTDLDTGDTLTYSAQLAGGGAFPAWLAFNPATRTFSGTPLNGNVGAIDIDVIANDGHGGTVTDTFKLSVNAAPVAADPEPAPTPITMVDGVPVVYSPGNAGAAVVAVPVVLATRVDDPGTPTRLADIPLVAAADGPPLVQVSVPVGVGLQSQGLATPVAGAAAQAELTLRIERAGGGSNAELTSATQAFLGTLGPAEALSVQTITPVTGAGFSPGVPLVINGSTHAGDGKQAIIVDGRGLPAGTAIQVDGVEFVAVLGSVRIIGGAGNNMASGDAAAQSIVLGAGDDIIQAGAGNDTIGSTDGADQLHGDAGDDVVFGGAGNDLLSGGTGSDRLNGGTGFDIALQSGKRTDYTATLEGQGIRLTHTATGVSDWLVDVEQVRFDTGPVLTVAHTAAEEAAAFVFAKWLGRDLTPAEGAVVQTLAGHTATEVATLFAQLFPQQAAGKTAVQLLDGMAGAGALRVDALREVTVSGDAGNNTISPTLGLARHVDGGAGIDTVVIPATLAQTLMQTHGNGNATVHRLSDGAMLDLTHVERLAFSDTQLALDITGNGHAGQAARLLGALGGADLLANKALVGEAIRALDSGTSAQALAGIALQALGATTASQVAQLLFTNLMGRAGTAQDLQPLADLLDQGTTPGELAVMAGNLDLNATRIDLVGLAGKGIEFV